MDSAELKTIREACGLSVPDFAKICDVGERTIRYWENGRTAVPADVEKYLLDLDQRLDRGAREALTQFEIISHNRGKPDTIELYRYQTTEELYKRHPEFIDLPIACHAAMLARARKLLIDAGAVVEIVYKKPKAW